MAGTQAALPGGSLVDRRTGLPMLLIRRFDRTAPARSLGAQLHPVMPRAVMLVGLLPVLLLAACGGQGGYSEYGAENYRLHGGPGAYAPSHYYPPPGPPGNPWGPYVHEAASRYRVPEQWVRAVMHQESGGQEQAVSPVGAMGLMQVMPATYEGLRERYGLGDDPYDPHNNVLAGTAYIREMYDRFGAPGFLAAYNAGPDRVDNYLAGAGELPDETQNYLAAVTPNLGDGVPFSGPFAQYASARPAGGEAAPTAASLAAGCDLNAAYDPNHPCTSLMRAARAPAPVQLAAVPQTGPGGCDLGAAYDPNHPCSSAGSVAAAAPIQLAAVPQTGPGGCDLSAAYDPNHPCTSAARAVAAAAAPPVLQTAAESPAVEPAPPPSRIRLAAADPAAALDRYGAPPAAQPSAASGGGAHSLAIPEHDWAIQVGAYANPGLARAVAEGARAEDPDQLRAAIVALPPTPNGGSVLYRARLVNLSASAAANACTNLNRRQLPCVVVQRARS